MDLVTPITQQEIPRQSNGTLGEIDLTRFRVDLFHLLLALPWGSSSGQILELCGCDGESPQDMLHFILFRKHYVTPRKLLIYLFEGGWNLSRCVQPLFIDCCMEILFYLFLVS